MYNAQWLPLLPYYLYKNFIIRLFKYLFIYLCILYKWEMSKKMGFELLKKYYICLYNIQKLLIIKHII